MRSLLLRSPRSRHLKFLVGLVGLEDNISQVLQFERIIDAYATIQENVLQDPTNAPRGEDAEHDCGYYGPGFLVPFHLGIASEGSIYVVVGAGVKW